MSTLTASSIATQATADQRAGIPLMRGRERYQTTAERAAYHNAWLESMRINGPSPGRA